MRKFTDLPDDSIVAPLPNDKYERNQYYFHPDHLGSSSYITDSAGMVSQHTEYLPFGEILLDEHANTDKMPYLYNGKELDTETGFYYYGARYYMAKEARWLSVDPYAEKYNSMSPYNYVAGNPLILVDPNGQLFIHFTKIKDSQGNNVKVKILFDGKTISMLNKKTGKSIKYENQSKFVNNMVKAYKYIVENGADVDNAMQQVASMDEEVEVKYKKEGGGFFKKTIEYDFSYGLGIKNKLDGENEINTGNQSSALGFWAEVYHAFLDIIDVEKYNELRELESPIFEAEENYVHVTKENEVIKALKNKNSNNNERKRNNYRDGYKLVKTKGVTSTEEIIIDN